LPNMSTAVLYGIYIVLFLAFVVGGFAILPDATAHPVPPGLRDGITYVYSIFAAFDFILPIRTVLDLFLLTISFDIAVWAWSFVRWVISIVRGSKA